MAVCKKHTENLQKQKKGKGVKVVAFEDQTNAERCKVLRGMKKAMNDAEDEECPDDQGNLFTHAHNRATAGCQEREVHVPVMSALGAIAAISVAAAIYMLFFRK